MTTFAYFGLKDLLKVAALCQKSRKLVYENCNKPIMLDPADAQNKRE
jgi:hypothetical protein